MIKIIIVEDQKLFQQSLIALLGQTNEFDVIATASESAELFRHLQSLRPDVILIDISLTSAHNIEIAKSIDEKMPWVKVISLSANNHPFYIKEMIRNGAKGFLSKNCSVQELYDGIRNVHEGKTYFCSICSSVLLSNFVDTPREDGIDLRSITSREIEILGFLSKGFTTREIAEKLFISNKTVERHKSNMLNKLNLRNTAQLVKVATDHGLLFS